MCLIVLKSEENASFSVEDFKTSFGRNNDGTGISYIEDGRIITERVTGALQEHLSMYYRHMHRPQFLLHHRMATAGEKTTFNVHPFQVLSIDEGDPCDMVMAHNGVISMSKFECKEVKYSDTHLFVREYLTPLFRKYPDLIEQDAFQHMLHDFIGSNNKLSFLRNDGMTWTFNKSAGTEHNGCWLSNKYSVESNHVKYSPAYGKAHGQPSYTTQYVTPPAGSGSNVTYLTDAGSYGDYEYEDGTWFREPWDTANTQKERASTSKSANDANAIVDAIREYAGLSEDTLKQLVVEDPDLAFDMINFMHTKEVDEALMNEPTEKVATTLYECLQAFNKKVAA